MEDLYKQAILDAKALRASAMANAKAALNEAFEPKIQEMIRLKLSEELQDELETEEYQMDETSEEMTDEGYSEEMQEETEMDEASLDEILAELEEEEGHEKKEEGESLNEEEEEAEESEEEESEEEEGGEESDEATEEVEDDTKVIDITLGDLKQVLQSVMGQSSEEEMPMGDEDEMGGEELGGEEEIDLDEILAELSKEKKEEGKEEVEEAKKEKEELKEAKKTIQFLKSQLNEVNLLNAKLLYMNKLFKSKNLTESQKISVVTALDRASNVKEAKNIYETLKESISSKKSQIKESIGFASKPAGAIQKTAIVESDAFVSRWQKIAGITK